METIKKRTMTSYVILNILTLGIYGLIVSMQMGNEVDMICEGDREKEISYLKAWFLGIVTGGIYLNYWWYRQANRLKVNGCRYGLEIRESGLDMIMHKTFCNLGIWFMTVIQCLVWPGIFILVFSTVFGTSNVGSEIYSIFNFDWLSYFISGVGMTEFNIIVIIVMLSIIGGIIPHLFMFLYFIGNFILIVVFMNIPGITGGGKFFLILCLIIVLIMTVVPYWSLMGYLGMGTFMKNLNRFADVAGSVQSAAFDPMAYEYYPAKVNDKNKKRSGGGTGGDDSITPPNGGKITGTLGSNTGYSFDLREGEELIIGKDPSVAHVIIPASYRDVSRKHCGIIYDSISKKYRVIDYSANGTFINGRKRLASNTYTTLQPGTIITLATTDNTFRLD